MSTGIHFVAGKDKHALPVRLSDLRFPDSFGPHPFFGLLLGQPEDHHRLELLRAIKDFRRMVAAEIDLISFNYTFSISGLGGLKIDSGFKVGGQPAYIKSQPGILTLRIFTKIVDGVAVEHKDIDLRQYSEFQTDDLGLIKIKIRRVKLDWLENLDALIAFLEHQSAHTISVAPYEERTSVLELVRAIGRGRGEDDAAGDVLVEMGEEGRVKLLELLANNRHRKLHGTICEFLTLFHATSPTRSALVELVAAAPNAEQRRLLEDTMRTIDGKLKDKSPDRDAKS